MSGERTEAWKASTSSLPQRVIDADGNEYLGDGCLISLQEQRRMGEPLIYDELDRFNPGDVKWFPEGAEATGNIWFSIPQSSKDLVLIYEPPFGRELRWGLGVT
jgi:hypothetical protein